MKVIRNIDTHDFEVPFNFFTYKIPKNKIVSVPDDLFAFLEERWPASFSFDVEVKTPAPDVERVKTKAYIKTEEKRPTDTGMLIEESTPKSTFGGADLTPPSGTTDKDGVSWYGEGVEIQGGHNGS